jgi:hypothetical protein
LALDAILSIAQSAPIERPERRIGMPTEAIGIYESNAQIIPICAAQIVESCNATCANQTVLAV